MALPRLANVVQPVLNLFLVQDCPLCGRAAGDQPLCQDCHCQLQDAPSLPLLRIKEAVGYEAMGNELDYSVMSWRSYGGSVKRAIARLKYDDAQPALAEPLGHGLGEAWLQSQQKLSITPTSLWSRLMGKSSQPIVVPVPLHHSKQQQRGFNQAEAIARSFCRQTGLSLLPRGLVRLEATQPQFELSPEERQRNVANAFGLGVDLERELRQAQAWGRPCRPVLLIDDVYTTGATVRAIAQLLQSKNIPFEGVAVVALARARRRKLTCSSAVSPPSAH